MSQAKKLPSIKRIELSAKNLRPYPDAKPVGTTPDGMVIWEGYVPSTNPHFAKHIDGEPTDNGHTRTPLMGPDKKQRWRRNKATGEAITPMFRGSRGQRFVRYVMVDMGNGEGGPRPVPIQNPEIKARMEAQSKVDDYQRKLMAAAIERNIAPEALLDAMLGAAETPARAGPEGSIPDEWVEPDAEAADDELAEQPVGAEAE